MKFKPVRTYIQSLTQSLQAYLGGAEISIIGIRRGGFEIAKQVHEMLACSSTLGELDISFYRDDFSQIGLHPDVKPSNIPFDVEGAHIVLIDDIIRTGRTIRAALNEIFDYGRPQQVTLACIFELAGRQLPIRPDVVVEKLVLQPDQHIKLKNLSGNELELVSLESKS